jgi:hypothetical protein
MTVTMSTMASPPDLRTRQRVTLKGIWQQSGNGDIGTKQRLARVVAKRLIYRRFLVGPEGFEPSTNGLREGQRGKNLVNQPLATLATTLPRHVTAQSRYSQRPRGTTSAQCLCEPRLADFKARSSKAAEQTVATGHSRPTAPVRSPLTSVHRKAALRGTAVMDLERLCRVTQPTASASAGLAVWYECGKLLRVHSLSVSTEVEAHRVTPR